MKHERTGALAATPSQRLLRALPVRVVTFLTAVGGNAAIFAALRKGGYRAADHEQGQRLLTAVCSLYEGGIDPTPDRAPREAAALLQQWGSAHAARLDLALQRLHPATPSPFAKLDFSGPGPAVLSAARLLARLQRLKTEPTCSGALPTLEQTLQQRAFDAVERQRLAELVRTAQRATTPAVTPALPHTALKSEPSAQSAQLALHHWYSDWATTAKVMITRKDWLQSLGLRRRRAVTPR